MQLAVMLVCLLVSASLSDYCDDDEWCGLSEYSICMGERFGKSATSPAPALYFASAYFLDILSAPAPALASFPAHPMLHLLLLFLVLLLLVQLLLLSQVQLHLLLLCRGGSRRQLDLLSRRPGVL